MNLRVECVGSMQSTNRSSLDASSETRSTPRYQSNTRTHRRPSYALSTFNTNNHNTSTKMSVAQQQQHAAGHDEDEDAEEWQSVRRELRRRVARFRCCCCCSTPFASGAPFGTSNLRHGLASGSLG